MSRRVDDARSSKLVIPAVWTMLRVTTRSPQLGSMTAYRLAYRLRSREALASRSLKASAIMVIMRTAGSHSVASTLLTQWQTWSPVASIAVAAIALIVSLAQARIAKKALRLSLLQDARRNARLDLNLKESVTWRPPGQACKCIGVRVLAVNPTDGQAALVGAELHISYSLPSSRILVLKVPHNANRTGPSVGLVGLNLPAALPSNGALEGWLIFQLDDALIGNASIESYEVMVSDSRGISQSVHPWIMKEITDHG